ncbi:MAG: RNA-protein complex protein Nop10 [Candidatus Thermoplasmatota archaeon]|jgi:H/ACA ribonucleoprotein complex subunit 3|nr:RNA-protein complex protein Nop10 [Candidatus Thermoplasmatota archaeon]
MVSLLYCKNCKVYTLETICGKCKKETICKNPPRFSPEDHYGEYRRKLKKLEKVDNYGTCNP